MKRFTSFGLGLLVGAVLFGGTVAYAAGIMAERSTCHIFLNGSPVEAEAYVINGNNYFKLRDIAALVDFGVSWSGASQAVMIDTMVGYTPEGGVPPVPTPQGMTLTGDNWAREDFSQKANPDVFTSTLTRDAYNAARQTIVDHTTILAGNDAKGYNSSYRYAHVNGSAETRLAVEDALAALGDNPSYATGAEPGITNRYAYPNYFTCEVKTPTAYVETMTYTDGFVKSLSGLSDSEKVRRIDFYVADRLTYHVDSFSTPSDVLNSDAVKGGNCMAYAHSFAFLCTRAGIPNLLLHSEDHQWNQVYVDGQWWHVDVGGDDVGNDISIRNSLKVLTRDEDMPRTATYTSLQPEITAFVKELLVPGSTK